MARKISKPKKRENKPKDLRKVLNKDILSKAEKIVKSYRTTIERSEDLGFIGSSIEFPTVSVHKKTPGMCYKSTQEALMVVVASMIECGGRPPQPVSAKKRSEQVNVRLTSEEKILLTNAASNLGFRGISDFLRNAALNRARSNH